MKCDVRLPYRMYVVSLHFVFTLFGVSCRDNFRRFLKYIPTQTQFFGLYRWFQRVLLGFYLLRNNQQNQNQYFFQMDGFTTK